MQSGRHVESKQKNYGEKMRHHFHLGSPSYLGNVRREENRIKVEEANANKRMSLRPDTTYMQWQVYIRPLQKQ